MKIKIYKWLCLFFYQQWIKTEGIKQAVGVPGQRDPDAPCKTYMPVKKQHHYNGSCETDGHYLCEKCVHNIKNAFPDPPEESQEKWYFE